ncbi:flagellar biosynthesis protein FliO [Rhizobium sp. PP-F2F-G48]|uniref:flagellar biosynthetic protein FliO n=1 Tax=Rhizobium sp. PP-F2F-G48 TaxID=2135651 RepID=UPI00104D4A3F|nr:flagellar biosynthetic protein FliO [Rhizobium sp. PP-F2F-G48]TCM58912.1 flagellar biosynthesis protein FliO [Rhizobium sp. PP-F2F-G48]
MFEDVVGNNGGRFIIAAVAVAAGLLLLVAVLWFMRNRASSPFIRGGKNRLPRLAVLDAAAVDTRRRLVLVRRDDVEHLIMIGGPTDIVIESRIVGANPGLEPPKAANAALAAPPANAQMIGAQTTGAQIAAQAAPANLAGPARTEALPAPPARIAQERRPESRAESRAEPRPDARAETRPAARPAQPPVSNMGQALYGDDAVAPRPNPAARVTAPAPATPPKPSPRPAAPAARAAPEDILEAARARVLPQIPSPPQPLAQPPAQPPAQPQASAPAAKGSPAAAEIGKRDDGRDFERLLDAQISGDLGRIASEPAPRAPSIEAPRPAPRKEPTLEEEMNRMLSEMGNERKS